MPQNSNHTIIACLSIDKTIIPGQAPLNKGQVIATSLFALLLAITTIIIWRKYRYLKLCSQIENLERIWHINYKSDWR